MCLSPFLFFLFGSPSPGDPDDYQRDDLNKDCCHHARPKLRNIHDGSSSRLQPAGRYIPAVAHAGVPRRLINSGEIAYRLINSLVPVCSLTGFAFTLQLFFVSTRFTALRLRVAPHFNAAVGANLMIFLLTHAFTFPVVRWMISRKATVVGGR